MMERIVKYMPITTIILLYLFGCGSLYLIGYWTTFSIDISNMVSITEIPKSFVLPFFLTSGYSLFIALFSAMTSTKEMDQLELRNKHFYKNLLLTDANFQILTVAIIIFLFSIWFSDSPVFWIISGATLPIFIGIKIRKLPFIISLIPNRGLRKYIIEVGVFTPIMCFAIGKAAGIRVYKNSNVKYIKAASKDNKTTISAASDSNFLKLLGFLGEKIIISSLDNKRIYVLNQSAFDVIELTEPEKEKKGSVIKKNSAIGKPTHPKKDSINKPDTGKKQ